MSVMGALMVAGGGGAKNVQYLIIAGGAGVRSSNTSIGGPVGVEFCRSLFGESTFWDQTNCNCNFRNCYAGIGYKFDVTNNVFVPPATNDILGE